MFLLDKLKGVWQRMIAPKTIENVLQITPTMSTKMKDAIELWQEMYMNESPWLGGADDIKSLGLAASISSEKARTATIEMEIKVTGDGERAEFMKKSVKKLIPLVRRNLEYGIALGSLVIKPYVTMGVDNKYKIEFTFTKATNFYPLSFSPEGNITEAAFLDRIYTKDTVYTKLEYHKLDGTTLYIQNKAFKSPFAMTQANATAIFSNELGTPIALTDVSAWASITPDVIIQNVDSMMFGYFRMPQANCIDLDSPLGVSGFSRAVKLIRDADMQYSNLLWEFEGGQLAIDVDRTAFNPMKDAKGNETVHLPRLQNRLYRRTLDLGEDDMYNVFSPQLRDSNILNGLNHILMQIEDACDISRGTLSEATYSEARTATELRILKQRSYSANCDIQKELEMAITQTLKVIDKYCDLYDIVPSGDYEIAYKWDDSIIVDKDVERQLDLLDIDKGLLSKVEYRMKWMGETKAQAADAIKAINEEKIDNMLIQQSTVSPATQQSTDNPNEDTDAQKKNDKANTAQDSGEITDINNPKSAKEE